MPRKKREDQKEETQAESSTTTEVPVIDTSVTYNDVAFGIVKDVSTGRWHTVKVPYDFKAGVSGKPEKIGEGDDRSIAIERFKIEVANKLMGEF